MSNQSLEADIKSISAQWQNYRDFCKTKSKTGAVVRSVNKNHEVYDLVTNQLREKIEKTINSDKYTVDASIGLGLLSAIPWVAIFDKTITQSASEGFYIVILFSRSAKKIFLNLSLGSQQFEKLHGRDNKCLETIRLTTDKFREMFNEYAPLGSLVNIDLIEDDYKGEERLKSSSRWLAKSYELGTGFSKSYNISDLKETNLKNDLEEFLLSYENIINDPQSISVDILSEKFSEKVIEENFSYEIKPFSLKGIKNKNKKKSSTGNKNAGKRKSNESHKTGRAGEDHVYEYEKNKLIMGNFPTIANTKQNKPVKNNN